jgi:hypothetical protein
MKNYGWNSVKLSQNCTPLELRELREHVIATHTNPRTTSGRPLENGRPTIHLYDKAGRKKLDALAWAIAYQHQEEAAGVR